MQNELDFRQIVDGISALVCVLTPDGAVEVVNQRTLDYFGKTLDDLKQWTSSDAVHPDDLPGVITVWTRSLASGEPYDVELRQRGADGSYRWFRAQGLPVRDAEGRIDRWCVLQTDIDERKRAEEEVRASERELRQLVDSVPGMIAVADAEGRSEYVNKRALDYLDTTAEEFRENPMNTVHPDDQELLRTAWLRCNELGEPMNLDHRVRRFDGVYRWVHVRGEPLLDDKSKIVRWYYVFTDIDDLRKTEDALRESQHHLELLVEKIPAHVARITPDAVVDYLNRRAVEYFGLKREEIHGQVIHPDDREACLEKWRQALTQREPWVDTYRLLRADGEYRWFQQTTEPLLDLAGHVVCWYSVGFDITDSRITEEALRTTQRKLSAATQVATIAELSASIAHEINQPLASIVANAHAAQTWLSHDPPNFERAHLILERIIRDGHSAADVVGRIRALFKDAAPVKARVDLAQIIAEVLGVVADEFRSNRIIVEMELQSDLPTIEADRVQLQQLLINLFHNAMEAMDGVTDRVKSILISSWIEDHALVIQVRDRGVGIQDPTLMFEPFFTTKRSGMGMGLSICRSIVEAHGGRIWATANEDVGMTVGFTLQLTLDSSA